MYIAFYKFLKILPKILVCDFSFFFNFPGTFTDLFKLSILPVIKTRFLPFLTFNSIFSPTLTFVKIK